ncbi:hypothetical protein ABZ816_33510 [Actinosynnema sp. NPDC047251]|uniref:hypothetical protein n=1 Tax=Saccharothrix espanaensis TaxID=103731 RepID=UPI0011DCAB13|nr:hypothetical protein [Saccharothrix espanaensis]
MRLPFAAHPAVRAEFERRWARVVPLLSAGFLGPPLVSVVAVAVGEPSGVFAWVLLAVGCAVPVGFFAARTHLRRTGWWGWLVGLSGAFQALGIGFLTLRPVLMAPTAVAMVAGVLLVLHGRRILLDPADGTLAGTSLGLRSGSRSVRSAAGRLLLGYASADDRWLRWRIGTGPTAPDVLDKKVALREIARVWVAEAGGSPGGPVVVVRTNSGVVELVVGDPESFAWQLDRRLRALADRAWPRP